MLPSCRWPFKSSCRQVRERQGVRRRGRGRGRRTERERERNQSHFFAYLTLFMLFVRLSYGKLELFLTSSTALTLSISLTISCSLSQLICQLFLVNGTSFSYVICECVCGNFWRAFTIIYTYEICHELLPQSWCFTSRPCPCPCPLPHSLFPHCVCWPTDCVIVSFARHRFVLVCVHMYVCVCARIMMCRALDCVCRRRHRSVSQRVNILFVTFMLIMHVDMQNCVTVPGPNYTREICQRIN